jgi:NADPH:quinone reductase-like Zn-dependent oxidoreductase
MCTFALTLAVQRRVTHFYKIQASTVSQNDCMLRRGVCLQVMDPVSLPATPGGDAVGYIIKIGEKVRHFAVGDRVATLVRTGGNARYISTPAVNSVQVPRSCDSAEVACLVSTYMTAYQALRMVTKDQFTLSGKRILVTGGIEPCGQALIQLCFRAGAEEVFATAPDHRHKYVKSVLGAQPLPVDPKDWSSAIKGKMDIVFDGAYHDGLDSPYDSLKSDGVLVCVGTSALLSKEQKGVCGAPNAAYWTKLKGHQMTNTKSYEVWDSFNANKDAFKVCTFCICATTMFGDEIISHKRC